MKNAHLSDRHKEIESFIQQVNAKTSSRTNESCVNIGGRESVLATNIMALIYAPDLDDIMHLVISWRQSKQSCVTNWSFDRRMFLSDISGYPQY